ncbi:MAG TPA: YetF domain-containing protein [Armatimonadota bacterium]|nr:YetF domain-containing protein [Armatimonadota bacterium]
MMHELAILVRILLTAIFLGIIVRMLGKRGWRAIRPIDLMVAVILGNLGHALILGKITMIDGIIAVGVLAWLHVFGVIAAQKVGILRRILWGSPAVLVRNGHVHYKTLAGEKLHERDLLSLLHSTGIDRLNQVHELRFEPDGELVLYRSESQRQLRRADVAEETTQEDNQPWQQAA